MKIVSEVPVMTRKLLCYSADLMFLLHVYRCVLRWRHLVNAYGVISLVRLFSAT